MSNQEEGMNPDILCIKICKEAQQLEGMAEKIEDYLINSRDTKLAKAHKLR